MSVRDTRYSVCAFQRRIEMGNGIGVSIAAVQARIEADARALSAACNLPVAQSGAELQPASGATVADGFRHIIQSVNEQDRAAGDKMAAVDAGRSDDLVGAMLASQQASLSFTMLMQARNKIVGAMEDLIKLQL